jgi:uncharacterized peroxidase-related enzyme
MSRLNNVTPDQATGELAATYGAIKKQMGGVVNLFQALGNNQAALSGYLQMGELLKNSGLSAVDLETVSLVSAHTNGCEYCESAHSAIGKMVGMKPEEILSIRKGDGIDPKSKALVRFVKEAVAERGRVSDATFNAIKAAGYSDSQITALFLAIAQNLYSNFFNNFNGTIIDFPKIEKV